MTALVTVAGVPFDQAVALVLIGAIIGATIAAVLVLRAWQRDITVLRLRVRSLAQQIDRHNDVLLWRARERAALQVKHPSDLSKITGGLS